MTYEKKPAPGAIRETGLFAAPSTSTKANCTSGLALFKKIFTRNHHRGELDRGSLPKPATYLAAQGLLQGNPRGRWLTIRCPFHKAGKETHPSLRVHADDGHFRCMACGTTGGDIIKFHQLLKGMFYSAAVRDLGGRFYD